MLTDARVRRVERLIRDRGTRSRYPYEEDPMPMGQAISKLILAGLLVAGSVAVVPSAIHARDATPAAGECEAPALPPGTPTPFEEMEGPPAEASPEVAEVAQEVAEAVEDASPEAAPAGEPADDAAADEAIAAAENFIACLGSNPEGAVALMTGNFLMQEFGSDNPYDALSSVEEVAPLSVESLGDARTHENGQLSVDLVFTGLYSPNSYLHERWYFVEEDGRLAIDQFESLPIETADVMVEAEMVDYAFNLSEDTFEAGQTIAFNTPNTGDYPHEFVVLRLPEGATVEQMMEGAVAEEDVRFFGFAFAEPGETSSLGLTGLEAGTYTVVCFIDVPEGIPHVARGMVTEFTVE